MMNVTDRFLKYVGYGTQSDPNTGLNPSTPGQMEFAHVLKEEMEAIGIQEVELDEYGYVMGVIPLLCHGKRRLSGLSPIWIPAPK